MKANLPAFTCPPAITSVANSFQDNLAGVAKKLLRTGGVLSFLSGSIFPSDLPENSAKGLATLTGSQNDKTMVFCWCVDLMSYFKGYTVKNAVELLDVPPRINSLMMKITTAMSKFFSHIPMSFFFNSIIE